MKIYLAGTPGIKEREKDWQKLIEKRLLSYHHIVTDTFNIRFAFELIINRNKNADMDSRKHSR